ncbi:MAG TPA: tetratricopeptide repeat protein [Pyrinomonadaceae bacterium]|nr:tetratricopeptide repeat protein [Pyrinomonadaceae bacterium]
MHFDEGIRLATKGLYPNAVVELKSATRANPQHAEAWLELGRSYHSMHQPAKAIKAYLVALEVRPSFVTAYKNLGVAYDDLGDFVKALKMYARAIVLAPQDPELRNDLGLVYFNIGSYAEAMKAFRQALEIDPHSARAHYYLGLVYLDLRDNEMAFVQHGELKARNEKDLAFQLLEKIQHPTRQAS